VLHDGEIGGKLLRACRGNVTEQHAGNGKHAQPFPAARPDIYRSLGHHQYPLQAIRRVGRHTKSSADQAIGPDRRHLNEVGSRSRRDP
jgi:hypothetical protein